MIEPTKNSSKVKKGLMVLNKLRGNNNTQDQPKAYYNNLSFNYQQPDIELDLKKLQCQLLASEDFMLSNADFHVKNLLTGFLEAVEEEDKSKLIESKIKTIKEAQVEFEENKVIDVFENEKWRKSKSKNQTHFQPKRSKNTSSKNVKVNVKLSSKALESKYYRNQFQNKVDSSNSDKIQTDIMAKAKGSYISTNSKFQENFNNSNSDLNCNTAKSIFAKKQYSTYQVYDISNRIKSKDKEKAKININRIKSSKTHKIKKRASIGKNDVKRRFSIQTPQRDISTLVENSLQRFKNNNSPFKHTFSKDTEKQSHQNWNNDEDYPRAKTYTRKLSNQKDNGIANKADSTNNRLSFELRGSIDNGSPNFEKCSSIKQIDILNLKGLSHVNKRKLSQICNKLKHNIVNDESHLQSPTKDNNMKSSSMEDNFIFKSMTTVVLEEKHRNFQRKGYVYDSLDDEEVEDEVEGKFYINSSSEFFLIYETLICITIIYAIFYKPFSLAHDFNIGRDSSLTKKIIDLTIDGMYIFDLCLRFFVPYQNFDEVLVTKNEDIALHYLSTLFICDLVAAIPINTILFWSSSSSFKNNNLPNFYNTNTKNVYQLFFILPIVKIFKLYKWNKLSLIIQNFFMEFAHFIRWSKVYLSLILLLLSVHLLSCIFIFLGQLEYPNWIIDQKLESAPFATIYIASVYYILSSVFTIGYGDITSISRTERLFNLFLLVVGIMVYSWSLSSISTYIQTSDTKTLEFLKKCAILEEIRITHEKMPYELLDKIQRFLRYKVKNEKRDKSVIFDSLPIILRNNLIQEMYKPIIENFIFFKNFRNPDFIVRVILAFKPILGLKNDILVKEGDYIEEIIFVKRGNLALEIPLPIIVNAETLKKNALTLTHSFSKSLNKAYTFNTNNQTNIGKNLYSLEDPKDAKDKEGIKGQIGLDSLLKTRTKSLKTKEAIATRTYVKILEIRKNEHFGDILMFLNRRSPLSVKVKSKYAEMFFLKKTDAIEISMNYPKIWRAINKKSLFNMEQIDRLINKALKLFFISNEGQKNLTCTRTSQFFETMIGKTFSNFYDNEKITDYPRTQKEILQLLTEQNEKIELQSIPSDLRSIIIEESQDYEKSSLINTNPPKNKKDLNLISGSISPNEKDSPTLKKEDFEEGSDSHGTLKMNINNKSIQLTEGTERSAIDESSKKSYNKKSTTPFRYSDINTEIYPNDGLINFESYTTSLNVNEHFPIINSRSCPNTFSSFLNQGNGCSNYNKENKTSTSHCNNHDANQLDKDDSRKSNDDRSEIPFENRESYYRNYNEDNNNYNREFKTVKISSPKQSQKQIRAIKDTSETIIKLNPIMTYESNNSMDSIKRIGTIRYSFCGNSSFTINSEYSNINEMNNYDISSTKNLVSAIFSLNIAEIEKALKKCNLFAPSKAFKRSSLSFTSLSLVKQKTAYKGTIFQLSPSVKSRSFFGPNEELKTMSDRLHKRKLIKAKSINIESSQYDYLRNQKESHIDTLVFPNEQKKFQASKFNQHFPLKSPTLHSIVNPKVSNMNINRTPTMTLGSHSDNAQDKYILSPNLQRRTMNSLKNTKTLNGSKPNLLNVISENIVKNSQNLNNPELFYLNYFQEIMNEKNDLKVQENLVKRLEDTEKFLFDSVRKKESNINVINSNNNT